MPVNAMTMPYLSAVAMTWSSRMEPPGSAMYADAGLSGPLHIVAEGEEGIGAHSDAGLRGDPRLLFLRGQRLGA